MDLIILAVAALVLLTVADARLWPGQAMQGWPQSRGRWTPRRTVPRRRPRIRLPFGLGGARRRTANGALWWWE